jgi:hypothetical protein
MNIESWENVVITPQRILLEIEGIINAVSLNALQNFCIIELKKHSPERSS